MNTQKWAAIACVVLPVATTASGLIMVTGPTEPLRLSRYDLAEFLGGPVVAVCLITIMLVLREKIGESAKNRMTVALIAAVLAAAAAITVGMIRTANRQYLAHHTEMNDSAWMAPMITWGTIIIGIQMAGLHFLGWALMLVGWSGWTSQKLPRILCVGYLGVALLAMFAYLNEEGVMLFFSASTILMVMQGVTLWDEGRKPSGTPIQAEKAA